MRNSPSPANHQKRLDTDSQQIAEEIHEMAVVRENPLVFTSAYIDMVATLVAGIPNARDRESKIQTLLQGRWRAVLSGPNSKGDAAEPSEEIPAAVSKFMDEYEKGAYKMLLGHGKSGMVLESLNFPDRCHKIRLPFVEQPAGTNAPEAERQLQSDIHALSLSSTSRVSVPEVYGYIHKHGGIIMMRSIKGPSVRQVTEGLAQLPPSFDQQRFFSALEAFVREMHSHGYFHRDLHSGNVMIDYETGLPWIIDFGMAVHTHFPEEDALRMTAPKNGHIVNVMLKSDESNLEKMAQELSLSQQRGVHP